MMELCRFEVCLFAAFAFPGKPQAVKKGKCRDETRGSSVKDSSNIMFVLRIVHFVSALFSDVHWVSSLVKSRGTYCFAAEMAVGREPAIISDALTWIHKSRSCS